MDDKKIALVNVGITHGHLVWWVGDAPPVDLSASEIPSSMVDEIVAALARRATEGAV